MSTTSADTNDAATPPPADLLLFLLSYAYEAIALRVDPLVHLAQAQSGESAASLPVPVGTGTSKEQGVGDALRPAWMNAAAVKSMSEWGSGKEVGSLQDIVDQAGLDALLVMLFSAVLAPQNSPQAPYPPRCVEIRPGVRLTATRAAGSPLVILTGGPREVSAPEPPKFSRTSSHRSDTGDSEGTVATFGQAGSLSPQSKRVVTMSTPVAERRGFIEEPEDDFLELLGDSIMGRMIKQKDWSQTSLGVPSEWRPEVRAVVRTMLGSPFIESVYIGQELNIVYNDAYSVHAGRQHPALLGKSGKDAWPEITEYLWPLMRSVMDEGKIIFNEDQYFKLDSRHFLGKFEERYFTWIFNPFWGSDGTCLAVANQSLESTSRMLLERRMKTILNLVEATSSVRTVTEFCQKAVASLAENPFDLPFLQLYTVEVRSVDTKSNDEKAATPVRLDYRGGLGVPAGHLLAPTRVDLVLHHHLSGPVSSAPSEAANQVPKWPFETACVEQAAVFLDVLPEQCDEFEARGWEGCRPHQGAVVPCAVDGDQRVPNALLVAGINAQGRYDDDYKNFFALLSNTIASGIVSAFNLEQDARKTEEIIALDRAKTSFYANSSHELRTPLTLILGPLEDVLSSRNLSATAKSKLKTIDRNARRLLSTVNTLLDVSRLELKGAQVAFQPARLTTVVEELCSMFRGSIERKGLAFIVDCQPDPEAGEAVYLSHELWEKVVFNILGNAMKYCQSGSITVRVTYTDSEASFAVEDTGIGLKDSELEKIFSKLYRVDNAGTRSQQGTGLGLALAVEAVKAHGGRVAVTSQINQGSTFTVTLPRGSSHLTEEQLATASATASLPTGSRFTTQREVDSFYAYPGQATRPTGPPVALKAASVSTMSSEDPADLEGVTQVTNSFEDDEIGLPEDGTVVFVEDNDDLRAYVGDLLTKFVRTVVFPEGLSALEHIQQNPPSLVLTDVTMPGLDGRELLQQMRAHPDTATVPVILLSAASGPEAKAEALEQGANDYLGKPFVARELIARIRTHLHIGRLRAGLEQQVQAQSAELLQSERNRADLLEERAVEADMNRRSLERFIDFTSHELRNPLNGVWQNAQAIHESLERWSRLAASWTAGHTLTDKECENFALDIKENLESLQSVFVCATHQGRIADDILQVSKLQSGLLTINPVPFDLAARVKETIVAHERECRDRNIILTMQRDGLFHSGSRKIIADPDRVNQVLLNFLTNAIKHSSDTASVRITAHVTGSLLPPERKATALQIGHPKVPASAETVIWASVAVEDTGKGMTPEEMQVLFARFSQVNPKSDQYLGAGLGLFITRQLVDLQNGCIDVESAVGKGTTFRFTWPVTWGPKDTLDVNGTSAPTPFASPALEDRPWAILVVEDNIINQRMLVKQLQKRGHTVTAANHGQEAIDLLVAAEESGVPPVDIILMDIEMPVLDGISAIIRIRQMEASGELKQFPAIAVTGNARQGQINECVHAGFDDVMVKPYSQAALLQKVDHFAHQGVRARAKAALGAV